MMKKKDVRENEKAEKIDFNSNLINKRRRYYAKNDSNNN